MKNKLAVLLSLTISTLSVRAFFPGECCMGVTVDHTDSAWIVLDSSPYVYTLTNGWEFPYPISNIVNIVMNSCVTSNQAAPTITFRAYQYLRPVWSMNYYWLEQSHDTMSLNPGALAASFKGGLYCGPPTTASAIQQGVTYCLSAPQFSSYGDWNVFADNELFNGTLACQSAYYFDAPRLHIQSIAYNFPVNFDNFSSYDVTSESVVGHAEGYWDTGIDNTSQVWTRARFEDESGNPLSAWSDVQCVNPL